MKRDEASIVNAETIGCARDLDCAQMDDWLRAAAQVGLRYAEVYDSLCAGALVDAREGNGPQPPYSTDNLEGCVAIGSCVGRVRRYSFSLHAE